MPQPAESICASLPAILRRVPPRPPAGLCDTCVHQRLVGTTRGSEFALCARSRTEPHLFARYPRVPVTSCPGYERRATGPAPSAT